MTYHAHRKRLFRNSIFYLSSKIIVINTPKKRYWNIKITIEEYKQFLNKLLLQNPVCNLKDFLIEHLHTNRQHEAVRYDGDSYPVEVGFL